MWNWIGEKKKLWIAWTHKCCTACRSACRFLVDLCVDCSSDLLVDLCVDPNVDLCVELAVSLIEDLVICSYESLLMSVSQTSARVCFSNISSCLFLKHHIFVERCICVSDSQFCHWIKWCMFCFSSVTGLNVRINITDLRVVCPCHVDLVVESLVEQLVESPVDLHVDPGVDALVELLVDGLVDLLVELIVELPAVLEIGSKCRCK